MGDLISKKALLENLNKFAPEKYDALVNGLIEKQPTVDAAPVVHGEWIKHEYAEESEGLLIPNFECSVCHDWKREQTPFCPECGADMRKKV